MVSTHLLKAMRLDLSKLEMVISSLLLFNVNYAILEIFIIETPSRRMKRT